MGKIIIKSKIKTVDVNGRKIRMEYVDNEEFEKFNPYILDLGDISRRAAQVDVIAAVFDLSGFTNFCNQADQHLIVPEYLSRFIDWLFNAIKDRSIHESYKEGKTLWAPLPFLAKFLGDGVLFLWDTVNMSKIEINNIPVTLRDICLRYRSSFYPEIKKEVDKPPDILRCGVARGMVCSVGNGEDYVGPCINIASRLQKLSHLTFGVYRKGFDFKKYMHKEAAAQYVLKSVTLRGIGEHEGVWVLKKEFDNLPTKAKELFREP